MGVLGESSALVGIKEDIVNIEGGGNKRLIVCDGGGNRCSDGKLAGRRVSVWASLGVVLGVAAEGSNGPETLVDRSKIKVDLDLVVLQSDQRKGKTRVGAEPELKRDVKSGLRKSVTRGTDLSRGKGVTRTIDISEGRIGDEGKLSGVTNHLEVTSLLLGSHGKLVPDVHPVTVLTVDSLTTNLNFNLSNQLLAREI